MSRRCIIVAVVWLLGVIVYIALNAAISYATAIVLMRWADVSTSPWYVRFETFSLEKSFFIFGIFWGTLYASALAKPDSFGNTTRILRHLGLSYVLGCLGLAIAIRTIYFRMPDFHTILAMKAFLILMLIVCVLCLFLAIASWIHLAFFGKSSSASMTADAIGNGH